jgi:hypothetical protein
MSRNEGNRFIPCLRYRVRCFPSAAGISLFTLFSPSSLIRHNQHVAHEPLVAGLYLGFFQQETSNVHCDFRRRLN